MTTNLTPEPIRKSSLPSTPPPEFEFFTWFPFPDDDGGDMVRGLRQRGVQVRRLVTYGNWEPVRPARWAPEPPSDTRAAAPPVSVVSGQTLRDRIAKALARTELQPPFPHCLAMADAVLAVLPLDGHTTDRADVLREAADDLAEFVALHGPTSRTVAGWRGAVGFLRRIAAEAEQPAVGARQPDTETPGCPDPIECSHEAVLGQAQETLDAVHALGTAWSRPSMSAPTRVAGEHLLRLLNEPAAVVSAAGAGQNETPEPTVWVGATDLASDREIAAVAATGIVGYRQDNGRLLHCLAHKPAPASRYADFHEIGPDDLDDGGFCVHPRCGRDLLARRPGQS